ncbi:MAG: CPBP family intramembrane metalloprotease [Armatimonadota bacterium]|nr:CPBP family intramembrane metalloprotease [Armatimonadota bacterium]
MAKNKTIAVLTVLVGAAIVVALMRFNMSNYFGEHYILVNTIGLLWVPMIFIFLIARDDPSRFGFSMSSGKAWFPTLLLFAGVMVFLVPASRMDVFQMRYPLDPMAMRSPQDFLFAEVKWGLYFFCWEFFFRGFLLFGLHRAIGWPAVIVQALAFGVMHYGKPTPEFIVSFPAGIILGLLALRSRSFFPCFLLHWASAVTFDVLVIWAR